MSGSRDRRSGARSGTGDGGRRGSRRGSGSDERREVRRAAPNESADEPEGDWVYGRHAVAEALRAGETLHELLVAGEERGPLKSIVGDARRRAVPIRHVPRAALDRLISGKRHQGVAGRMASYQYHDLDELVARAMVADEPLLLLALDAVQDVHNLGSLLRSAEAAGAHGAVVADREAASITPAVRKASAGAVAHLPVARMPLHEALDSLAARGVKAIGLDGEGESEALGGVDLVGPVVLVVGSEGHGLSSAVSRRCDALARLPMAGKVGSLNAAVAGSILLYEALRQRREARVADPEIG